MKIIEPGHKYRPISLDGQHQQQLVFVRRIYPLGKKVPVYPGTTSQEVLRIVHDRTLYLDSERAHWVNPIICFCIRAAIWLYEYRAARQRRQWYWHTPLFATTASMCAVCGHTACREHA